VSRTNVQRSLETRTKLLEATLTSLVERGFHGTSTAEVCRRAAVSKGAQLHHYPTKAKLVSAAVEHLLGKRREEFERAMRNLPSGADRLDVAFDKLWQIYSGPTLGAWMELVVASRTDPVLREAVAGVNRRFADDAEIAFREVFGVPDSPLVPAAARLVMALFDGLATTHFLEDDAVPLAETIALFKQLIAPWTERGLKEST
jgi:AcrR family transcriptional regulator